MNTRTRSEVQECLQRVPGAVKEAARELDFIGPTGLSSPGEVADCASDQLGEWNCSLDQAEFDEVYAAITRHVLDVFGFDGGASDAADITAAELAEVAEGRVVRRGSR